MDMEDLVDDEEEQEEEGNGGKVVSEGLRRSPRGHDGLPPGVMPPPIQGNLVLPDYSPKETSSGRLRRTSSMTTEDKRDAVLGGFDCFSVCVRLADSHSPSRSEADPRGEEP